MKPSLPAVIEMRVKILVQQMYPSSSDLEYSRDQQASTAAVHEHLFLAKSHLDSALDLYIWHENLVRHRSSIHGGIIEMLQPEFDHLSLIRASVACGDTANAKRRKKIIMSGR